MNTFKHHKRIPLLSFLVVVGIMLSQPLRASHIIGGEISYECLGNNQYRISLDVYRDCYYGIADFDSPAYVTIFNASGALYKNLNLAIQSRDTVPNNINNDPCLFPPLDVCVEHAHYESVITITGLGDYYIVYQRCCRNQTINNIVEPDSTGSTYFVKLTQKARQQCNNSPKFGFYPPVFVCVNKPLEHPHSATLPMSQNGDSLSYKFITPYKGATFALPQPNPFQVTPPPYDVVDWAPGYNLNQILGITMPPGGELKIDPHTGMITGFPMIEGQFVVGVLVQQWRNGGLMSEVFRDFQYNVGQCAELNVQIEAPDAQCDDLTVHFGNNTDVAQHFIWYFDWPNLMPSSTEFEPTYTFPDTGTYMVRLVAEPVGQCVDDTIKSIFLQYNSLSADFSWQNYDCTDESILAVTDLSVDNVSPPVSWHWTVTFGNTTLTSNLQNPVFEVPNPVTGTITLMVESANGCKTPASQPFTTGDNNPINLLPGNIQICIGESAQLNPAGALPGFTYQWGPPVPANQQNLANPTVAPLQTTVYQVTVTGYNALCQSTGTVTVTVSPAVSLAFAPDTDCDARIVHFINQSQNAPTGYVWNFGDPTTTADVSTEANPTYTYPAYGTYTVTLMTAPNAVCKDTISQQITLTEKILEAGFTFDYEDCQEDAVTIHFFDATINNLNNTASWLWEFSGIYNGTSNVQDPVITVAQEGTLNVQLTVTTDEDCISSKLPQSLNIDFTELPGLLEDEVLGCLNGGVVLNQGGNPSYLYQWSPATGLTCNGCPDPTKVASPLANPSQTTTYTVNVLNISADTCDITRTVTVVVPPNVGLVVSDDVVTCDPTALLNATTSLLPVTYAWFDENGNQYAGNVSSITVPVSGYDYYVVRATDQPGCFYYDTVRVIGGPADIVAFGDSAICTNEMLDVFAQNLDPNDTLVWQWAPNTAFSGPTNVPNPTLIIAPGAQSLVVNAINQFGCPATDTVDIAIVDENIQLDFDYEVDCDGGSVQFFNQSQNAFNYLWDFGDPSTTNDVSTATNPSYDYNAEGVYPVTLTIGYNVSCVEPIVKNVEVTDLQFVVDFNYDYLDCSEDSINVQFFDNTQILVSNLQIMSWHWETCAGDTSNLQNPIFTVYEGEEFCLTLSVTMSNDCVGTDSANVKLEFTEVNLEDTLFLCQGDSVFINPLGNTAYQYQWTPNVAISNVNAPNPRVWPTTTTTYFVEIKNLIPDTCSLTRAVTVFVPEKIAVAATGDTLSCGAPLTLTGASNVSPTTFAWKEEPSGIMVGNNAVLNILPSTATTYKVVGTDQYGCQDSTTINTANETVQVSMQNVSPECPGSEVGLSVQNLVANHNLDYDWSAAPPGQIVLENGASATVLTPPANGTATYTVVATNQFGCKDTLSQDITSYNFVPTVVDSVKTCPDVPVQINPGANPELTYKWSPTANMDPPAGNVPNPTVTIDTTTVFTVIVSQSFGQESCRDTIDMTVFVPPVIVIDETVDTFTCGSPITIFAQTNVATTIEWQDEAGNVLGGGNSLTVNPTLEETYLIVATDIFDCQAMDTVVVSNNQVDIATQGSGVLDTCPAPSFNICIQNLDPNDNLNYIWTPDGNGSVLSGNNTPCADVAIVQGNNSTFTLQAENQWGCTADETVQVITHPIDIAIDDDLNFCEGDALLTIPVQNNAPDQVLIFNWAGDSILSQNTDGGINVIVFDTTSFYTDVVNQYGCTTADSVMVFYYNIEPTVFEITSTEDTIYYKSGEFSQLEINFVDGYLYEWVPQDGISDPFVTNPQAAPEETTTYTVIVTDEGGCIAEREVTIVVINPDCDDPYVFLPNAFTPNGDGENDVLYFRSNIVDKMELAIYNRWGQKVFESNDINVGWDGTYKGKPLPPDVFGFYLKAVCFNGQEFFKKGNITLLR
ncbi:MAG: gliding motility-associated C-terminal domain-containing protein [Lewinellaceae bacterium]|nr:gliding motility-associated C-terminal domain-containing protein [Saprospiraceae bacterium]MCB9338369.1 gliding motility-associated C-terminal domain-containing protein [Lewinellaceae bacterium]